MNTRFIVFASYKFSNICVILSMFYICNCLKVPRKSQINEYSDLYRDSMLVLGENIHVIPKLH